MEKPKKGLAALVLAMGKPKKEADDMHEKSDEKESESDLTVAAEDVLQAIEDKDPESLAEALKDFYDICS